MFRLTWASLLWSCVYITVSATMQLGLAIQCGLTNDCGPADTRLFDAGGGVDLPYPGSPAGGWVIWKGTLDATDFDPLSFTLAAASTTEIRDVQIYLDDSVWRWEPTNSGSDVDVSPSLTAPLVVYPYSSQYAVTLWIGGLGATEALFMTLENDLGDSDTSVLCRTEWNPSTGYQCRIFSQVSDATKATLYVSSGQSETTDLKIERVDLIETVPSGLKFSSFYGCPVQPAYQTCNRVDAPVVNETVALSFDLLTACGGWPCSDGQTCTNLAASLTEASRSCGCQSDFMQVTTTCIALDVVAGSLQESIGSQEDLVRANTLSIRDVADTFIAFELNLVTSGPVNVTRIRFGLSGEIVTVQCSPDGIGASWNELTTGLHTLHCRVATAVGEGWTPTEVQVCVAGICEVMGAAMLGGGPRSPLRAEMLIFPGPTIDDGTLKFSGVGEVHVKPLVAKNAVAELLTFEGTWLYDANMPGLTQVFYGPPGNPRRFQCEVKSSSTASQIVCLSQDTTTGTNMFTVVVGGQEASGTDTYKPPDLPTIEIITASSGCQQDGLSLINCPTSGGVEITVHGTGFNGGSTLVFVGGNSAAQVTVLQDSRLTCIIPAGAGRGLELLVSASSLLGRNDAATISFGAPSIEELRSANCTNDSPLMVSGCLNGGGLLTIIGNNFLPDATLVFVGQTPCTELTAVPGARYSRLTCQFAAGMGVGQGVLVITSGQVGTTTTAALSYALCPATTYAKGLVCEQCEPGSYSPIAGLIACAPCAEGRVSGTGASRCDPCPQGKFSGSKTDAASLVPTCELCAPGTFSNTAGASSCTSCLEGTVASGNGTVECTACAPGRYRGVNDASNARVCNMCPAGAFSGAGAAECSACPSGRFSDMANQSECQECPEGRFQKGLLRATECTLCQPGRFSSAGEEECTPCGAGLIAPRAGSSICVACPVNAILLQGEVCACREGYYALNNTAGYQCRTCPEGARCSSIGTESLIAKEGWWHSSTDSTAFYSCQVRGHCPASRRSAGAGGTEALCPPSREGPLCALCKAGYSAVSANSATCNVCQDKQTSLALTIAISSVLLIIMVVLFAVVITTRVLTPDLKAGSSSKLKSTNAGSSSKLKPTVDTPTISSFSATAPSPPPRPRQGSGSGSKSALQLNDDSHFISEDATMADFLAMQDVKKQSSTAYKWTYTLKIVIGFLQAASSVAAMEFRFPAYYRDFISAFSFVSLNFLPWSTMDCIVPFDVYSKTLTVCLVPPAVFLALLLFVILPLHLIEKRDMADKNDRRARMYAIRQKVVRAGLLLLFLIYPSVSQTILQLFICREVNGTLFIVSDFTQRCTDERWFQFLPVSIFFVLLYPIGILALFWTLLLRHSKTHRSIRTESEGLSGFLWHAYNKGSWWFEIVDMLYKLTLVSMVRFFPLQLQLPVSMITVMVYTWILLLKSPYVNSSNNLLSLLMQVELLVLLQSGYTRKGNDDFEDDGIESVLLSGLLIVLTFLAMIVFLLIVLRKVRAMTVAFIRKRRLAKRKPVGSALSLTFN